MRHKLLAAAAAGWLCAGAYAAGGLNDLAYVSTQDAQNEIGGQSIQTSRAAIWVWTDKQVYQPGDPITVRWTLNPNSDLYPYTIVAYLQNNQTGVKTYFPGNNSTATDIFGNTVTQGFRITRLPSATKQVLVGNGGLVSGAALSAPNQPGMHTAVVELRDYTGGRIIKAAYFKFGIVEGFTNLTGNITQDTTLVNTQAYRLSGIVAVLNDATLTIQPGTIILGQPGSQPPSVLLITTAGKIMAKGTRSRPIIMTSSQPVGSRQRGDWGGFIALGLAPLNDPGGVLSIEGLPEIPETRYGGNDPAHSCGTLSYVRVEFAGSLLRPNEETNSFTFGSCGSGTVADHLAAAYGLDDSFEWFGGTMNAKYLVGMYGADDYVDGQIGWVGKIQHGVFVANSDLSNRGFELDNYEQDFGARPLGEPTFFNMTFVGSGGAGTFDESTSPCVYTRRGSGGHFNNIVCFNWSTGGWGGSNFDAIAPNITAGTYTANGIVLWDNGKEVDPVPANTISGQVSTDFQPFANDGSRQFLVADPMLSDPLRASDPDFRPLTGSPLLRANWVQPPDDGFFDQSATYVGAFDGVDWTEEWTNFTQEQDMAP